MLVKRPVVAGQLAVKQGAGGFGERPDQYAEPAPGQPPTQLGQLVVYRRPEREVRLDGLAVFAEERDEACDSPGSSP